MKATITIIGMSVMSLACGYTLLSEEDDSDPAANAFVGQNPRETKPKPARAEKRSEIAQKTEGMTFDEYLARRRSNKAATAKVDVDPRWEFSPREALESLGTVQLFYAVAPTDTGARDICNADAELPRHFGLTVWNVKMERDQAELRVACLRLVDRAEDAAPNTPPASWSWKVGGQIYHKDKILAKEDIRICGNVVRFTRYLPYGQCNVPFHERWQAAFLAGGWAVYITSTFPQSGNARASALDVVRAADRVTHALRNAKAGLERPKYKTYKFEGIRWGSHEAWFKFLLEPARGREICANLWNRVQRKHSETGVIGYGSRIIKVSKKESVRGEAKSSVKYGIRSEAFQFDWADEFGVGGSIVHKLDR